MNNKFLTGLATALMTTVGTTTLIGVSLQSSQASNTRDQVDQIGVGTLVGQEISDFQRPNVVSFGPIQPDSTSETASKQIATLYVHPWQSQLNSSNSCVNFFGVKSRVSSPSRTRK